MRPATGAIIACLAALMLTTAAAAKCVEGPDPDFDDGTGSSCKTCSADGTKCEKCWRGNGLTAAGECVPCNVSGKYGRYCDVCDGEDVTFCLTCGSDDEEAWDFALYATADGQCKKSPVEHCIVAESLTSDCTMCNTQFGLIDGKCESCEADNCIVCDGDASKCTQCYGGFVPDPETALCVACPENCDSCSSVGTCDQCDWGFALNDDKTACVACPEGCDSCSSETCDSCKTGYAMVDGVCKPCGDKYCTSCDDNTDICKICNTYPEDGSGPWGVDKETGGCAICNIKHCHSCQEDVDSCDWCADGYTYNDKTKACDPDSSS